MTTVLVLATMTPTLASAQMGERGGGGAAPRPKLRARCSQNPIASPIVARGEPAVLSWRSLASCGSVRME
jgi:hypothetical protein